MSIKIIFLISRIPRVPNKAKNQDSRSLDGSLDETKIQDARSPIFYDKTNFEAPRPTGSHDNINVQGSKST